MHITAHTSTRHASTKVDVKLHSHCAPIGAYTSRSAPISAYTRVHALIEHTLNTESIHTHCGKERITASKTR